MATNFAGLFKTNTPYYDALAISAATLVLKGLFIRSLVIRTRVAMGNFLWPEDASGLNFLVPILKLVFGTSLKSLTSADDQARLLSTDKNNMDHEPYFLTAALAWGYLSGGNPGGAAAPLLYTIVATRFVHNIAQLVKSQPLRTFAYLPGLIGTIYIGVQALLSKK